MEATFRFHRSPETFLFALAAASHKWVSSSQQGSTSSDFVAKIFFLGWVSLCTPKSLPEGENTVRQINFQVRTCASIP